MRTSYSMTCGLAPTSITDCVCMLVQASSKDYNTDSSAYARRVLVIDPFSKPDVLYVPSIFPSFHVFAAKLKDLTREHGLCMGAEGRIAYQTLESLVGKVARETAALQGKPLSYYSTPKKGGAARFAA
eukprot:5477918-Pleurochrysis_carterae.AAC.1